MQLSLLFCVLLAFRVQALSLPSRVSEFDMDRVDKEKYYQQREKVQLQMLENEVAKEMTGTLDKNAPPPTVAPASKNTPCLSGGSETTLTEYDLKLLINSVFHTFDEAPVNQFYGTTNYGMTVSKNTDPLRLLWNLDLMHQQPAVIWLNHPPFLNTSHYLMETYMTDTKPTIQILGMFSVRDDLVITIEEIKCLAKLKALGFTIKHWDFEDFKSRLDALVCKELITMATSSNGFMEELITVQTLLQHVDEIQSSNMESWCNPPAK